MRLSTSRNWSERAERGETVTAGSPEAEGKGVAFSGDILLLARSPECLTRLPSPNPPPLPLAALWPRARRSLDSSGS